ncbi:MAG: thioredoxin [Candidatus Thorarchaeota archaeon]|nr:thioredoxin [Candidatus Thorarchaeota archaeon]
MTPIELRENHLGGSSLILFFTSNHCAWCDIVKGMLDIASIDLGEPTVIYEVNIDRHQSIAEAYGIMMVPALVSKGNMICGVPTSADLTSFLMQSATESIGAIQKEGPAAVIRSAGRLMGLSAGPKCTSEKESAEQIKPIKT